MGAVNVRRKRTETAYWISIAGMATDGLTPEQDREKMYRDVLNKGDIKGVTLLRDFQDEIHPIKPDKKPPATSA